MNEVKCDTCERVLKENELKENREKNSLPFPGMPTPYDRECFPCFIERADFDGPNNNFWPNHEKDEESFHKTLKDIKKVRDN